MKRQAATSLSEEMRNQVRGMCDLELELELDLENTSDAEIYGCSPKRLRRDSISKQPRAHDNDRLSALPDELLTRILGLVSTKDAAILTLVSNKFMPAFLDLNNLEFDDHPISHCVLSSHLEERTPPYKNFVDYVLRSRTNYRHRQQLDSFTLRFGRFHGDYKRKSSDLFATRRKTNRYSGEHKHCHLESSCLKTWICFPVAHRVRKLDLCLYLATTNTINFHLPCSFFVCETLETLKLDTNLDFDFDQVDDDLKAFPIRLPRLKLLHLRNLNLKHKFVTHLVNSCPVLDDLLLHCWLEDYSADNHVLEISSPSLLNLDLSPKDYNYNAHFNLIIQTPNLQSFKYWANLAQRYSITHMNALVQAEIRIRRRLGMNQSSRLCSILESCSTVSHLYLTKDILTCLDSVELKNRLPVFHNLHHLELGRGIFGNWDKVLVQFLECSPSLQTLVFSEGIIHYFHYLHMKDCLVLLEGYELEREFWRRTETIPSCCKSHLRKVVINKYIGTQREVDLVQFLLRKALFLESLDIWLSRCAELDPVSVQTAMQEMPRASTFCSIRVFDFI